MPVRLAETARLLEAAAGAATSSRRFRARIIEGDRWGSSGYYSREVLERDGPTVWPSGTQVFLDHPTESEHYDRPERSVRDLAGRIASTPVYEADGLYADVEVYPHVAPVIEAMADDIGLSIRASAEVEHGEAEGRTGTIITRLTEGISVDFVTRAGAGGRIVSLIESARRAPVREATANDRREQLDAAIRDTYGDEDRYAWVRDFDEDAGVVWFERGGGDVNGTFQQSFTVGDDDATVTLTGDPLEVTVRTQYVPVTDPAGQSNPTEESKEDPMPEIAESELQELREAAGRVQALEERATTAERSLAEATARNTARPIVTSVVAESTTIPARRQARVVDTVVAAVTPDMDEAAVRAAAEAARTEAEADIAELAEALGAGSVRGFGHGTTPPAGGQDVSEADVDAAIGAAFGIPTSVKEA